jgi:hypothetical protein
MDRKLMPAVRSNDGKRELKLASLVAGGLAAPLFSYFLLGSTIAIGQSALPQCSKGDPSSWDNCQGTYTFANGYKQYVGAFKDGKPNGQGTETFANGDQYVGEFKDGQRSGQGTLLYANGYKYVGQFRDDLFNGQGTKTFPGGSKYVGKFKGGLYNGKGIETLPNGYKFFVGEFSNGLYNGIGTQTFSNGDKYVGEFKDGKKNGQGTETFASGDKYVGEFRNDFFDGIGTYTAANGSVISTGLWADGKFVGKVGDQETIGMEQSGGVYVVAVRFNNTITLNAVIDSGAADVSVPADIVSTLKRTNTITREDFLGTQTYVLADGSKVPSQQFRIRSLKVGNKTVENVVASIASVEATILLGQSFLRKFKSWSVDNEKHTLVLR